MTTLYKAKKDGGERIAMTEAEQAEQEEAGRVAHENAEARRTARAIEKLKKASGKQKLKDLGLDDEEIKQLTGA